MLLGAIADDFTGATDLANTLVKAGMRTVQTIGVPSGSLDVGEADAVVVALKSRTIPASEAISQSLDALAWLRANGAAQIVFKYCSTFDSTDAGNIGPVSDALLDALGADFTIACPAFPGAGRTIYRGYLFVNGVLLSESGMRNHPLTPMTDPNLVRVLQRQTQHKVGLVAHEDVAAGADAIRARFDDLRAAGVRHAIVDAVSDADLMAIGRAVAGMDLVTGGSGIAMGLPENLRRMSGQVSALTPSLPKIAGTAAVIAGSCSEATRAQVAYAKAIWPSFDVDVNEIAKGADVAAAALQWAAEVDAASPILFTSSAPPDAVAEIQRKFGRDEAGNMVEAVMGEIARGLTEHGIRKFIVAGGETSGAVVGALRVAALRIGPEIDPGVPWTEAIGGIHLALALKSGNFGAENFFEKALDMIA